MNTNIRSIEEITNKLEELKEIYNKLHNSLKNVEDSDNFKESYQSCQIIEAYINSLEWVLGNEILIREKTIYGI